MIVASLLHFARTGRLGDIGLGSTPAMVSSRLGEPENVREDGTIVLWKYGCLEFMFQDDRIFSIELTFDRSGVVDWPTVAVEDDAAFAGMHLDEFEKSLAALGIEHRLSARSRAPERSADATLLFADAGRATFDDFRLASLSVYASPTTPAITDHAHRSKR